MFLNNRFLLQILVIVFFANISFAQQDKMNELLDRLEKIQKDIQVLNSIVSLQQKMFERVNRRAKYAFTSETDRNVVYSKLLQNKNQIRENDLKLSVLMSEIDEVACTPTLEQLNLNNIPVEETVIPVDSNDFLNSELAVIEAKLTSKLQEVETVKLSLYPELDLKAEIPVSSDAETDANLGFEFNVSYGNMGQTRSAELKALEAELNALTRELESSSFKRIEELKRLQIKIDTLQNSLINNQKRAVESLEKKLEAKERLFKAGRVSLFELISVYDEFLSEQLKLNSTEAELKSTQINIAANLDFVYR